MTMLVDLSEEPGKGAGPAKIIQEVKLSNVEHSLIWLIINILKVINMMTAIPDAVGASTGVDLRLH